MKRRPMHSRLRLRQNTREETRQVYETVRNMGIKLRNNERKFLSSFHRLPFKKYGFTSKISFFKSRGIQDKLIEIYNNEKWPMQKMVLYHCECPLVIKQEAIKSGLWYKRFAAYFKMSSDKDGFVHNAKEDNHSIIKGTYNLRYTNICNYPIRLFKTVEEQKKEWVERCRLDKEYYKRHGMKIRVVEFWRFKPNFPRVIGTFPYNK